MSGIIENPKVGDVIYVETELYLAHGADDFRGGKATVSAVKMQSGSTDRVAWIEVAQNPGTSYNWPFLAERQVELAVQFGETWAHPDPDLRPEFNERES